MLFLKIIMRIQKSNEITILLFFSLYKSKIIFNFYLKFTSTTKLTTRQNYVKISNSLEKSNYSEHLSFNFLTF